MLLEARTHEMEPSKPVRQERGQDSARTSTNERLAGASQALILHIASETSKGDTVAVRGMGHCPNTQRAQTLQPVLP